MYQSISHPELNEESADIKIFLVPLTHMAAEALELHLGAEELVSPDFCPTAESPPWREIQNSDLNMQVPGPQGQILVEILKKHVKFVH